MCFCLTIYVWRLQNVNVDPLKGYICYHYTEDVKNWQLKCNGKPWLLAFMVSTVLWAENERPCFMLLCFYCYNKDCWAFIFSPLTFYQTICLLKCFRWSQSMMPLHIVCVLPIPILVDITNILLLPFLYFKIQSLETQLENFGELFFSFMQILWKREAAEGYFLFIWINNPRV